jgi:hypothetical protein
MPERRSTLPLWGDPVSATSFTEHHAAVHQAVLSPSFIVLSDVDCCYVFGVQYRTGYQHNAQSNAATSIAIKINPQVMDVRLCRREAA